MSLRIIKAGILDTVQDLGRNGYQHLGINPSGAMDTFAAQLANMLAGNNCHEAVLELHFPASTFLFEQETMLALGGADFSPSINGETIPLWQPVLVAKNSILQFQKWKQGARCYLAFKEKLDLPKWLNSFSTNLKAAGGGFKGRVLQKDDILFFKEENEYKKKLQDKDHVVLPWKADIDWNKEQTDRITLIQGNEWDWLTQKAQDHFLNQPFIISSSADRMGYRLQGSLQTKENKELVSSAVSFGTIQLLPNGELIILMADHQTTGGYPRIAHVISAHLPLLAQKRPGEKIHFQMTTMQQAEELLLQQQQHLQQLQNACTFRLEEFFQHADN
jgi:antagonist of KipI